MSAGVSPGGLGTGEPIWPYAPGTTINLPATSGRGAVRGISTRWQVGLGDPYHPRYLVHFDDDEERWIAHDIVESNCSPNATRVAPEGQTPTYAASTVVSAIVIGLITAIIFLSTKESVGITIGAVVFISGLITVNMIKRWRQAHYRLEHANDYIHE